MTEEEKSYSEDEWNLWDAAGLRYSGYSSDKDAHIISVFIEMGKDESWYETIADRLGLDKKYVELLMEILCSAEMCEYGTSPRGAWAVHGEYQANIAKLKAWYSREWNDEFQPMEIKK